MRTLRLYSIRRAKKIREATAEAAILRTGSQVGHVSAAAGRQDRARFAELYTTGFHGVMLCTCSERLG
jgi:hypothetical protein